MRLDVFIFVSRFDRHAVQLASEIVQPGPDVANRGEVWTPEGQRIANLEGVRTAWRSTGICSAQLNLQADGMPSQLLAQSLGDLLCRCLTVGPEDVLYK